MVKIGHYRASDRMSRCHYCGKLGKCRPFVSFDELPTGDGWDANAERIVPLNPVETVVCGYDCESASDFAEVAYDVFLALIHKDYVEGRGRYCTDPAMFALVSREMEKRDTKSRVPHLLEATQ